MSLLDLDFLPTYTQTYIYTHVLYTHSHTHTSTQRVARVCVHRHVTTNVSLYNVNYPHLIKTHFKLSDITLQLNTLYGT